MPVRIIFRGLVLFRIENERGKNGRIVAQLVDCKHMMGGSKKGQSPHTDLHKHIPEIQFGPEGMASGNTASDETMAGMKSATQTSAGNITPPKAIQGDIDIRSSSSDASVKVADSYRQHCPNLSHILNNRPHHLLPRAKKPDGKRNKFVSRIVTIYGGTIRVNEVVAWDGAAYPLASSPNNGSRFTSPAEVSFLTSTVRGHMASECVVEVESVDISKGQKGLPTHIDDGEILITNLPPERPKPVPWSLHFFCLFQAAGYSPADIDGNELDWFKEFGRAYDPITFPEDEAFLGKDGHTGFPFPYLDPETALTPLNPITPPLTDPWNRPLCPQGDNSLHP